MPVRRSPSSQQAEPRAKFRNSRHEVRKEAFPPFGFRVWIFGFNLRSGLSLERKMSRSKKNAPDGWIFYIRPDIMHDGGKAVPFYGLAQASLSSREAWAGRSTKPVVKMHATHSLRSLNPPRFHTMPMAVGSPQPGEPTGLGVVSVPWAFRPWEGSLSGTFDPVATTYRSSVQ